MKKILFATTAIVATAGMAAAEVSIGGNARFGTSYNSTTGDWNNSNRLRFQFSASTETDGGVKLSAMQRIQTSNGDNNKGMSGARFSVGFEGLTVNMGNINGVIDSTPNLYMPTKSAGVGLDGNGFHSLVASTASNAAGRTAFTALSSGGLGASGSNGVEVIYNIAGVNLHAHSTRTAPVAAVDPVPADLTTDPIIVGSAGSAAVPALTSYAVGVSYTMSGITGAVSYEEFSNNTTYTVATVGGKIGQINAALAYAETKNAAGVKAEKWALKGAYDFGNGLNAYGFVASENNSIGESYGLGASFALGGGASVEGGWTRNPANDDIVSIGVFFSF